MPGAVTSAEAQRQAISEALSRLKSGHFGGFGAKRLAFELRDVGFTPSGTLENLQLLVNSVFSRAVAEPPLAAALASLAYSLTPILPSFRPPGAITAEAKAKRLDFRGLLLNLCQKEFEAAASQEGSHEHLASIAQFLAWLLLHGLLTERILLCCLVAVAEAPGVLLWESIGSKRLEALVTTLLIAGRQLHDCLPAKHRPQLESLYGTLRAVHAEHLGQLPVELQAALVKLLECEAAGWEGIGPVTLHGEGGSPGQTPRPTDSVRGGGALPLSPVGPDASKAGSMLSGNPFASASASPSPAYFKPHAAGTSSGAAPPGDAPVGNSQPARSTAAPAAGSAAVGASKGGAGGARSTSSTGSASSTAASCTTNSGGGSSSAASTSSGCSSDMQPPHTPPGGAAGGLRRSGSGPAPRPRGLHRVMQQERVGGLASRGSSPSLDGLWNLSQDNYAEARAQLLAQPVAESTSTLEAMADELVECAIAASGGDIGSGPGAAGAAQYVPASSAGAVACERSSSGSKAGLRPEDDWARQVELEWREQQAACELYVQLCVDALQQLGGSQAEESAGTAAAGRNGASHAAAGGLNGAGGQAGQQGQGGAHGAEAANGANGGSGSSTPGVTDTGRTFRRLLLSAAQAHFERCLAQLLPPALPSASSNGSLPPCSSRSSNHSFNSGGPKYPPKAPSSRQMGMPEAAEAAAAAATAALSFLGPRPSGTGSSAPPSPPITALRTASASSSTSSTGAPPKPHAPPPAQPAPPPQHPQQPQRAWADMPTRQDPDAAPRARGVSHLLVGLLRHGVLTPKIVLHCAAAMVDGAVGGSVPCLECSAILLAGAGELAHTFKLQEAAVFEGQVKRLSGLAAANSDGCAGGHGGNGSRRNSSERRRSTDSNKGGRSRQGQGGKAAGGNGAEGGRQGGEVELRKRYVSWLTASVHAAQVR